MSKRKKQPSYRPQDRGGKKNLRRVPMVITAQTDHHLAEFCAMNGWGEKDKGRVVDKLMVAYLNTRGGKE